MEQKFGLLEALLNKKMVKGLQQLSADTKLKMTQIQTLIVTETNGKLKLQEKQINSVSDTLTTNIDSVKVLLKDDLAMEQKGKVDRILD